jgi:hypothetical protein
MLKADLVQRILYKRLLAMLNLELQTKDDPGLLLRLLQYHVALYEKHKVPVISVILYLFQTAIQLPLYQLTCADETSLQGHLLVGTGRPAHCQKSYTSLIYSLASHARS